MQNQPGRRFADVSPQQPVYRFPQNQQVQGWQPQQSYPQNVQLEEVRLSRKEKRELNKLHHRKRRKIFTWWNFFAIIGIVTVIVQAARYLVIPLLVYLNVLSGGAV